MMMARVRKTLAVFISGKKSPPFARCRHRVAAKKACWSSELWDVKQRSQAIMCVCVLKNYQNIKGRLNFTISPLNIFLAASSSPHPIACVFRLWKTCWKAWHIVHVHDENYNRCWESTKIIFRCLSSAAFFSRKRNLKIFTRVFRQKREKWMNYWRQAGTRLSTTSDDDDDERPAETQIFHPTNVA